MFGGLALAKQLLTWLNLLVKLSGLIIPTYLNALATFRRPGSHVNPGSPFQFSIYFLIIKD